MTNSTESLCPKCGAPITRDAPQGLCPMCVLSEAATLGGASSSLAGKTSPPTVEEVATHFPELEILELIGAGGMGAVYKARQPKIDRLVALKILSHDLAKDPAFAERFQREARVLARLNHPNIIALFDTGTAGPYAFLLMEYVDGVNLRQAMRTGGFTPPEALTLVQDVCSALKFAHEEGILHRDIKPENVLLDSRGRVKIADFGIAKLVGQDETDDVTLTVQGAALGSPHYMAPEQLETPGDIDQRADIYSLGVVLYEMLTGELPLGRFALPSEKAAIDARIDEIVLRTLAKEREARYQSAGEVRTEVEAFAKNTNTESGNEEAAPENGGGRRFRLIAAATILIGLVVAGVSWISGIENRRLWKEIEQDAVQGDASINVDSSEQDPDSPRIDQPLSALDGVVASMMHTNNELVFLNLGDIGDHTNYLTLNPEDGGVKMRFPVSKISRHSMRQAKYVEPLKKAAHSSSLPIEVIPDTDRDGKVKGAIYVLMIAGEPEEVSCILRKVVSETFGIQDWDLCSFGYENMPSKRSVKQGEEPRRVTGEELVREYESGARVYLGESVGFVYLRLKSVPLRSPLPWNDEIWCARADDLTPEFLDRLRKERAANQTTQD